MNCAPPLTLTVPPTPSAAYYIAPAGNDITGNGSFTAPWATLDKALTAMRGSSVKLAYARGGTYAGAVTMTAPDSGVQIIGYSYEVPIFTGAWTLNNRELCT